MKVIYYLIIICLCITSFVSAEDCFGMDADCPSGFYVNCWEDDDSFNWDCKSDGGQAAPNVLPDGSRWCDSGYVIDYNTKDCCPEGFPYQQGNTCNYGPQQAPAADNYYTRQSICTQGDTKCANKVLFNCLDEKTGHYVYDWVARGKVIGMCGFEECYAGDVKCVGVNYYTCADSKWVNNELVMDKCKVECLADTDCAEDVKVNDFCRDGKVNVNYKVETCEIGQCVPDSRTDITVEVGNCGIECVETFQCAENRTTGKYWKDKKLYTDFIYQNCSDNLCVDIVNPVFQDSVFDTFDVDIDEKQTSGFSSFVQSIINWFKELF